jgi:hypothetical protein
MLSAILQFHSSVHLKQHPLHPPHPILNLVQFCHLNRSLKQRHVKNKHYVYFSVFHVNSSWKPHHFIKSRNLRKVSLVDRTESNHVSQDCGALADEWTKNKLEVLQVCQCVQWNLNWCESKENLQHSATTDSAWNNAKQPEYTTTG